jgi:hypothetical protein
MTSNKPWHVCHCHTCDREIKSLGIMRHRAMHRDNEENCVITYSTGERIKHIFEKDFV